MIKGIICIIFLNYSFDLKSGRRDEVRMYPFLDINKRT